MQCELHLIHFKYHELKCHSWIVIKFNDTDTTASYSKHLPKCHLWFSHICQCIPKLGILDHCADPLHIKNRCYVCALLCCAHCLAFSWGVCLMEEFINAFYLNKQNYYTILNDSVKPVCLLHYLPSTTSK